MREWLVVAGSKYCSWRDPMRALHLHARSSSGREAMKIRFDRTNSLRRLKGLFVVRYYCDANRDVYLCGEVSGS